MKPKVPANICYASAQGHQGSVSMRPAWTTVTAEGTYQGANVDLHNAQCR